MRTSRSAVLLTALIGLSACDMLFEGSEDIEPAITPETVAGCGFDAVAADDRARVLANAAAYLDAAPRTVTADIAPRSEGGPNDFHSEGDYWWPVEGDPDAPYERRDGQSNPDNFVAHRLSMLRLSDITGSLASAYLLTGEQRYADAAARHLRAWFVDTDTAMTPRLLYAQAIQGRHTGRSIGLIDTLHLVEPARAAKVLGDAGALPADDYAAIKAWFAEYAQWMNTHPYGIRERDWHNNHSIAWGLQVAAFSDLTGQTDLADLVREEFKTRYLGEQMAEDGSFPNELERTKPYGYSLFVIDLMAGIAQILSTPDDDLWTHESPNGTSLRDGLEFIAPHVTEKSAWPYAQDIAYWDDWPVRHPALVFAGEALKDCSYYGAVQGLPADSDVYEVRRNFPLRHPLIWMKPDN